MEKPRSGPIILIGWIMQALWGVCKTIFCKGVLFTQYADGLRLSQSLVVK
jgi:hypothetical protein